ncbi:restriction endonuclease subunit S [Chryseobacterium sp. HSC-36S06]|uniref:restriction endonuclease subunit S n=1 Tax=Chryseobacterium sp. HSC-36S06 TaxID=2910970 RepID=UPI00209EFDF3|nr:restriction endonuclease subunit S [Chryseobacterium sp. HSC-36S06]MCP2038172.1 type I restriction enzyme S subunit [Chryseobacterium sp. HSC-36S06]
MKKYDSYKDSGVKWLGEIPAHWDLQKLKWIFTEKRKITNPSLHSGSISFGKVVYKDDEKIPAATKNSYQVVNKGEFLLNPLNLNYDLKSLRIALSEIDVVVSSGYIVLQNRVPINKEYFKWLLHLYDILYMKTLGAGVRQTINFNDISESLLCCPDELEQQAIAEFLDDKTTKIDQAIAIKEKEINLLKERRQILIQKAVTKGLDPSVKMKDSGVDWIGEIPEHWEVRKLKYIGKMFSGLTNKKGDDFSKEPKQGFSPFIPFTNIFRNNKISEHEFQFVKSNSYDVQNIVEFNDILFLMSSETFDDIGKNSIYLGKSRVFLNSFCKGFKIFDNNVNPLFINFLLLSKNYREYFASVGRGFTRINIKQEYVLDMPILYIPINEQTQIVVHLEEIEEKIAKAILLKQQETEKLKEYKTVLIDNVVTGKIKVS